MSEEIRKETDFWGNEKEVIYKDGNKVGEIRREETFFGLGPSVKREYDNAGNKVGETRREETLFGLGPTVDRTYAPDGEQISETRKEQTLFGLGPQVERSYDKQGRLLSETRYEKTFLGFGPTVKRVERTQQDSTADSITDRGAEGTESRAGSSTLSTSAGGSRKSSGVRWLWLVVIAVAVGVIASQIKPRFGMPVAELPPIPFVDFGTQVDLITGEWILRQPQVLYDSMDSEAKPIARLARGARVQARRIGIRSLGYRVYRLTKSMPYELWNFGPQGRKAVNDLLVKGDRFAVLSYFGEGECRVWVRGDAYVAVCPSNYEDDAFSAEAQYGEDKTEIWAEIATASGMVGYLRNPDAQGMSKHE